MAKKKKFCSKKESPKADKPVDSTITPKQEVVKEEPKVEIEKKVKPKAKAKNVNMIRIPAIDVESDTNIVNSFEIKESDLVYERVGKGFRYSFITGGTKYILKFADSTERGAKTSLSKLKVRYAV